ncbi:MAG TPA: CPBP family intramembrane glutamic endopeptidase [Holophagaceae bacterium]|nr:CPBP family intramembrane glutamic endopeptidase [Holophagaceae bacterium]
MSPVFTNPHTGRIRNGWRALGWCLLLVVALLPLGLISSLLGHYGRTMLVGQLVFIGSALFATRVSQMADRQPFTAVGLRLGGPWMAQLGIGIFFGCAIMGLGAVALRATGAFHWEVRPGGSWLPLLTGFGLFLLVGISEELTFRGYLFQRFLEGLGPWVGQLAGGLLFAVVHWGNPGMSNPVQKAWATVNITLAGILLGLAYVRTRSLALPIGIHLGWNWFQGCVLGFPVSGTTNLTGPWAVVVDPRRSPWFHGGTFGLEASVFASGACAVAILLLYGWEGISADPSTDGAPADRP